MTSHPKNLWPIPVQLVAAIAYELSQQGVSTEQLLSGTGVCQRDIKAPKMLLPYRTTVQIITQAIQLSSIPGLGLVIGTRQTPSSMGILGHAINCCASVADAMNMAVKYARVSSTLLLTQWWQENDKLYWSPDSPIDLGEVLCFAVEEEFSMLGRVFEMLTGKPLVLLEAHFRYPEPEYVSQYVHAFNCPLFFSADNNQLIMDSKVVHFPILQANPLGIAAAERMCIEFLNSNPATDDLTMRIRQLILEERNDCWGEEHIAARLNITSRTLRNQLRRLGTSYLTILNSLREQIAKTDLDRSSKSISEVAADVGYSDTRSFRRAFKKWTGMTPGEYRTRR